MATKSVEIPKAYILQQGWHKVVARLKNNNIAFTRLEKDTLISVEVNHIDTFETRKTAYEGHYLHYNTSITKTTQAIQFNKGDVYIDTNQNGVRYVLETLEAEATDSFFNWNFFDTILQQKEGFSSYVFEDVAAQILADNAAVKRAFDEKMKNDTVFAKNPSMQLNFIYKNSQHYEKAHLRVPVFKIF